MIIAALSTAPGKGGIAIIRLSGEGCHKLIINKYFESINPKKQQKLHAGKINFAKLYFGNLQDKQTKKNIDEVNILFFNAKNSYTGEESLEIHCHGSMLIVRKILNLLYQNEEITEAEPGEFTQKRFLNGKIDLVQAEAVTDLINAESENSLKSSQEQLSGGLSNELARINQMLIDLLSHLELELDFIEEEIDHLDNDAIEKRFNEALEVLQKFIDGYSTGKKYREGIKVALVGKVNAGKSSLMNALLNENRVIVTDVEGTTRDIIEEKIEVNGYLLKIVDTAGLRKTTDVVEQEGIKRTEQAIENADLLVHVVDISQRTDDFFTELEKYAGGKFKQKTIKVLNKIDILDEEMVEEITKDINELLGDGASVQAISCKEKKHIQDLKHVIVDKTMQHNVSYTPYLISNLRHFNILESTKEKLTLARESLLTGMDNGVIIVDVRDALDTLGELTGKTSSMDILNNIFGSFCIGK